MLSTKATPIISKLHQESRTAKLTQAQRRPRSLRVREECRSDLAQTIASSALWTLMALAQVLLRTAALLMDLNYPEIKPKAQERFSILIKAPPLLKVVHKVKCNL